MRQSEKNDPGTKVVVDDTTIYEVDMECYRCLTDRERELYFDGLEPGERKRTPEHEHDFI